MSRIQRIRKHPSLRVLRTTYAWFSQRARVVSSSIYDLRRFLRWSFAVHPPQSKDQMRAFLTMNYHAIEKGLALAEPRIGFGTARIEDLVRVLNIYSAKYGCDPLVAVCINVLKSYKQWNAERSYTSPLVDSTIETYRVKYPELEATSVGGVLAVRRAEIHAALTGGFGEFALNRHSIRQYTNEPVDIDVIRRAIKVAQKTPSVCNRQTARVHIYQGDEDKRRVLSHQAGNRGFGDQAAYVLIVTSDLRCFASPGERFQCWIDGGMFAMSLIYAIHAEGLGSCALNWSATSSRDKAMRRDAKIPDHEVVMMMISVGRLPESFDVARSPRKSLDEIVTIHGTKGAET